VTNHLNRASVRRLLALYPDAGRAELRSTLIEPELAGPVDDLERRFGDYLLDPCGMPLVGDEAWFAGSLLLRPLAPGCAVPIGDDVAAIVSAPRWLDGARLGDALLHGRFASRADEAVAAAVAQLPAEAALAAIHQLAAEPGPDEAQLHLALLQAGRALAWRRDLLDGAGAIVDRLLALLDRRSPRPLLQALCGILGPLAATAPAVRTAVLERARAARGQIEGRRSGDGGFLAELQALDRPRTMPDEDFYLTLPDREVMEAASEILGRSAEDLDRDAFGALQAEVLEGELGSAMMPRFVDGLISAAALEPLTELVAHLLRDPDHEPRSLGLHIAAQIPIDECADAFVASLEDRRAELRARAVLAVRMLRAEVAVPALVRRLDDPDPGVCARAGLALVELGQDAVIRERRMPGELAIGKTRERTAAVLAALPDPSLEVAGVLLPLVAGRAEVADDPADEPLVEAATALVRGSADGIRIAAAFVREIPDALPIIALALAGTDDDPTPVVLRAELRAELASALDPIIDGGGDAGFLALETLARFSPGDGALIERIAAMAAREDGYAQHVLAALAYVRRRSERAAEVLAPLLEDREHLPATVLAAGVAGVALPVDHRLWDQVRELLAMGTHAAAAAHVALVARRRIRCDQ
jgi:hypothetical protein